MTTPPPKKEQTIPQPQRVVTVVALVVLSALFFLIGWRVPAWILAAFAVIQFGSWKFGVRSQQ